MELYRFPFLAMGGPCELQLYADDEGTAAWVAAAAIAEVERIEARYSRYRDDSLLAQINRQAAVAGSVRVDAETAALLDYAWLCYRKSDGLFDISAGLLRRAWNFDCARLPAPEEIAPLLASIGLDKVRWQSPELFFPLAGMELDFGGIAKEYAADQAAAVCAAAGIGHGLVELGGDICVIGPHPDGAPWVIGIRDPRDPGCVLTVVELKEGAIATSGNYERHIEVDGVRYCHILNPRTGWPPRGLAAVSVVSSHCLVAGSIATIALLKGEAGQSWLHDMGGQYIWVDELGNWEAVC